MQFWTVGNPDQLKALIEFASEAVEDGKVLTYEIKKAESHKNWTQHRAMHRWFELIAADLNAAGMDQRAILKEDALIPWAGHSVKENLWKPIQLVLTGKESTTDISGAESGNISETLVRHFAEKFGIELPEWPREAHNEG